MCVWYWIKLFIYPWIKIKGQLKNQPLYKLLPITVMSRKGREKREKSFYLVLRIIFTMIKTRKCRVIIEVYDFFNENNKSLISLFRFKRFDSRSYHYQWNKLLLILNILFSKVLFFLKDNLTPLLERFWFKFKMC